VYDFRKRKPIPNYRACPENYLLKLEDIDSKRMVITFKHGKGNKDRLTILSQSVLNDLRTYYKEWKPKTYLFEGKKGNPYTATSVLKIIKNAAQKANIR